MTLDEEYRSLIDRKLKDAGEWCFMRYPQAHQHPAFKSAPEAAQRLLDAFPQFKRIAVTRDQSLRPLRELLLERDLVLLVPDLSGEVLYRIPRAALYPKGVRAGALRISPMQSDAELYEGPVDAIVTACLAFSPESRRIYSLDPGHAAIAVENVLDRYAPWNNPDPSVKAPPVICLACDAQQVAEWPPELESEIEADFVVTSTSTINQGVQT